MIGYIYVALSVLFFSAVNITDKIVSNGNNKLISLFLRYSFSLFSGLLILFLLGEEFVIPETRYVIYLLLVGVVAYMVNIILYRGLAKLNTGTFFMLGYSYLIFLFFINIMLYGGGEVLSFPKTIVAFIFIGYVMYLTYISGRGGNKHEFLGYIFAILCALGWTFCFGVEGYMIKNAILSPVMTVLLVYIGSIITAITVITAKYIITPDTSLTINPKNMIAPALGGMFICLGSGSLLFAYEHMPINVANILGISEMLMTTVLAIFILKEKHPKKEIRKILFGFIILVVFISVR